MGLVMVWLGIDASSSNITLYGIDEAGGSATYNESYSVSQDNVNRYYVNGDSNGSYLEILSNEHFEFRSTDGRVCTYEKNN